MSQSYETTPTHVVYTITTCGIWDIDYDNISVLALISSWTSLIMLNL